MLVVKHFFCWWFFCDAGIVHSRHHLRHCFVRKERMPLFNEGIYSAYMLMYKNLWLRIDPENRDRLVCEFFFPVKSPVLPPCPWDFFSNKQWGPSKVPWKQMAPLGIHRSNGIGFSVETMVSNFLHVCLFWIRHICNCILKPKRYTLSILSNLVLYSCSRRNLVCFLFLSNLSVNYSQEGWQTLIRPDSTVCNSRSQTKRHLVL